MKNIKKHIHAPTKQGSPDLAVVFKKSSIIFFEHYDLCFLSVFNSSQTQSQKPVMF